MVHSVLGDRYTYWEFVPPLPGRITSISINSELALPLALPPLLPETGAR